MGPPPVLGQDGQNDEESEVSRQLVPLVKNQVTIGQKKNRVKEFLPDRLGVHVRPDRKHQSQGNVEDHVQVGRDEKIMSEEVQSDQGKDHAPDKVTLPARHQFTRLPQVKRSIAPSANLSDIEIKIGKSPQKASGFCETKPHPLFKKAKFDFWAYRDDLKIVIGYEKPKDTTQADSIGSRRFPLSVA